jgi:hypothetical protein
MKRFASFLLIGLIAVTLSINSLLGLTFCLCPENGNEPASSTNQAPTTEHSSCPCEHQTEHDDDHTGTDEFLTSSSTACDHHTTLDFTHTKLTDELQPQLVFFAFIALPPFLDLGELDLSQSILKKPLNQHETRLTFHPYLTTATKRFPRA